MSDRIELLDQDSTPKIGLTVVIPSAKEERLNLEKEQIEVEELRSNIRLHIKNFEKKIYNFLCRHSVAFAQWMLSIRTHEKNKYSLTVIDKSNIDAGRRKLGISRLYFSPKDCIEFILSKQYPKKIKPWGSHIANNYPLNIHEMFLDTNDEFVRTILCPYLNEMIVEDGALVGSISTMTIHRAVYKFIIDLNTQQELSFKIRYGQNVVPPLIGPQMYYHYITFTY